MEELSYLPKVTQLVRGLSNICSRHLQPSLYYWTVNNESVLLKTFSYFGVQLAVLCTDSLREKFPGLMFLSTLDSNIWEIQFNMASISNAGLSYKTRHLLYPI